MYGSVEQAFVGRDEPKNDCEGGYFLSDPCHFFLCRVNAPYLFDYFSYRSVFY